MDKFNSDDHYIYYCGQESLRRNGVAITLKSLNAVLGCNLKNDRMISVHFQGKPFNITVIQVYIPNQQCWRSWSSIVLWRPTRPSKTNTQKICPFHYRGPECRSRKSRNTWSNSQIWPWSTKWSRVKPNRVLPREHTGDKLWKILQEMGIPDHVTCLLRNLYAGQEATVRTWNNWLVQNWERNTTKLYIVTLLI